MMQGFFVIPILTKNSDGNNLQGAKLFSSFAPSFYIGIPDMRKLLFLTLLGAAVLCGKEAQAQKPALDHTVYDKWETLGGYAITDDGRWVSYYSNREENDGTVNLIDLKTGNTTQVPRGARTKFSPEGKHLVFTIRPTHAQQKEAKLKKLKGDKLPKDTLAIMELATGKMVKFPALKSVEIPREGGNFIAFKVEHKEALPDDSPAKEGKKTKAAKPKTETITVIYNLSANTVSDTLKEVDVLPKLQQPLHW